MNGKSKLGGPKTAKRRIQIRKFIEEERRKYKRYSSPFVGDSSDSDMVLSLTPPQSSFHACNIMSDSENEEDKDEILIKGINLDEADKFIASLKLPCRRNVKKNVEKIAEHKKKKIIPLYCQDDLEQFKKTCEKLNKIKSKDVAGSDESTDELII